MRLLQPSAELDIKITLGPNVDKVASPAGSVVGGLDDPRAVEPAMQRETGEEAVLTWLEPGEPDPSHAGKSRLLREDLDVAEGVEQCDVLSSKIKYGVV